MCYSIIYKVLKILSAMKISNTKPKRQSNFTPVTTTYYLI